MALTTWIYNWKIILMIFNFLVKQKPISNILIRLVRLWQGVLHTDKVSPHSGIVYYGGNSSVVFYGRTGPASEYTR